VNSVETKRAYIRVFYDAKHLSQVVLPIIPIVREIADSVRDCIIGPVF
jgi:hypothetical protein